jgi:hypothetical protein
MLGRLILGCVLFAALPQTAVPPRPLISVWYAGPGAKAPATVLADSAAVDRDLERIRRAGFNAITTWIRWADAEAQRDTLRLGPTERLIAAATQRDLEVVVRILVVPSPAWAATDGAAADRFALAVRARLERAPGVRRIQVVQGPDSGEELIQVGPGAAGLATARLAFWESIARGQLEVAVAATSGGFTADLVPLGETAGVVTRNEALFAPLRPRTSGVREITGAGGAPIDVRLLESPQALMIIAVNRAASPRAARIQFAQDIPEAIWQNLETGAAVNFVMGKTGPYLEHSFAPHDALVLMIRKTLR